MNHRFSLDLLPRKNHMADYIIREGILYPAARCPICAGLQYPANALDAHIAWHASECKRNALNEWDRKALGIREDSPRGGIEKLEGVSAGRRPYRLRNKAA